MYNTINIEKDLPFISIIIPCRNEEIFIGKCLDTVIANDYPKERLEILVVDGMSEDKTRAIIERFVQKYKFITIFDNYQKITPCALNIGIKNAKGQVIMVIGSHSIYESNYISKSVKYLNEYGADNVGGVIITLPRDSTLVGKGIVNALSSRFGVGGSAFRIGSKEPKWVDTVFGGCYKREVFEKVGLFNEDLVSTQDMEFNLRLRKAGGKILLIPDIVSCYYARSDLKSFFKNNFRNGFWAIYPFKFTEIMPVSWRHLVPLTFVSTLIISGILSNYFPSLFFLFLLVIVSYVLTNFYYSTKITLKEGDWRYLFLMPFIFISLHIGYGLGSLWGAFKLLRVPRFWNKLSK